MDKFDRTNEIYLEWLNNEYLDENDRNELKKFSDEELLSAFASELEFGTAGIRGIMGVGPSKFNQYTIKKVTMAYARLLLKKYPNDILRGVVIGHDNRYNSKEFAKLAAEVLTSFGIKAYLFKDNAMKPTPVVSFATKFLNCIGGVVITASHNPAQYNGYKIYDEFGCQLLTNDTDKIAKNMQSISDIISWTYKPIDDLLTFVPTEVIKAYTRMIEDLQFYADENKTNFKIIYSNIHGTGIEFVPKILQNNGFEVITVKEHLDEDPSFKDVDNPNPEFESAWKIPFQYAKTYDADLIILTDPDADRLAIAIKHNDEYIRLTGNETGTLLIDWKLSKQKEFNKLPQNPALYSSFVTSDLGDRIAKEKFDATIVKTLTGFKWMGAEIAKEKERNLNFVFAYEESIGYVLDDSTRDKDGIQAAIVAAEMTWYYLKNENKNLIQKLDNIYAEFDYYYTDTINLNFAPEEIKSKVEPIMKKLRTRNIDQIAKHNVINVEDYADGLYNMPGQNLLKFYLDNKSWFAIRPSGTEPKIKIYFVIVENSIKNAKELFKKIKSELMNLINI
ncbi:phospho-sugar mutase [Spiroplasma endosymbiont of Labia minor]|uniref:phospho-sugar mutase n=1 Tax=Spiroplasma endosymbiont of Labia minor TaxID=3066305 RepID=UPI0030D10EB3